MALAATMTPFEGAFELRTQYGFCVIPLRLPGPDGKKPTAGFKWEKWQTELPDEDQVEAWNAQLPGVNWGVVCGPHSNLVVVDCDNQEALDWAKAHLPHTPWWVRTGNGWHLYYKYPYGREKWLLSLNFKKKYGIKIDIQRDGKYVVAPCSVHKNGAVYTPHFNEPWDYVPDFDVFEKPQGAENMADALAGLDLSGVKDAYAVQGAGYRHDFLVSRIGGLIGEGLTLDEVKAKARALNAEYCQPPGPIAEVHRICEGLYKKDKSAKAAAAAPQDAETNIVDDDSDPLTDCPWPDEALHPGGILEKIMNYTKGSSVRTETEFALGGSIATMGAILGQRVRTETNLVTNMYCVVLGASSSGKDAPKRSAIKLLEAVDPSLFAGSDVSSDVAVLSYLRDNHRACLVFDEIGALLRAAKRQNSHKGELVKFLTAISSQYDCTYKKSYADQKLTVSISWLSLSLLGLSVPGEYYASLQDGESTNGWLARNLVFEALGPLRPKKYDVDSTIPEDLLADLKALWAIPGGEGAVVMGHDGSVSTEPGPAQPTIVYMTPEAKALHESRDGRMEALGYEASRAGREAENSIRCRAGEQAWKLALIHAASRLGADVVNGRIETADVSWAWSVVNTSVERLCLRLSAMIFASEYAAVMQQIREEIQRYRRREAQKANCASSTNRPKPGAPVSYIYKRIKGVPTDVIDKAIKHMEMANELRKRPWPDPNDPDAKTKKTTRPLSLYCLVKEKEEE